MNFMRKIVNQSSKLLSDPSSFSQQDHTLSINHLKRLFSEVNKLGVSAKEIEINIYNMLPLFCKIFSSMTAEEMMEKFPDVLQFCNHASRLLVSEIRRRASIQSTEAASQAIVKYLEIESTEEQSSGWMLLTTINLLASVGHEAFINGMTIASLPSTLVKCFYLFFDLPELNNPDLLVQGSEFTVRERRVLLQKIFVQLLTRLCSYTSPAEELVRKDDMMLLFNAITSPCPLSNLPWRRSAAEVLLTLSRCGLTPNVVQYIHENRCVGLCIENIEKAADELSAIEKVEMLVNLFAFLKDSSEVSHILLDDFRSSSGYTFLADFLLSTEKLDSEEAIQALRNLILLIGSLTTCGFIELKPNLKVASLFQMPDFIMPQSTENGLSIRNIQAFQVLQIVFLKASSQKLCNTILDVIMSLYNQDLANYFILESQNTLAQFAEKIYLKPLSIKKKFFEIIEFVAFNLNYVPCKELVSTTILMKTANSIESNIICLGMLIKLLNHHSLYKEVFREVGVIEVLIHCLKLYCVYLDKNKTMSEKEEEILESGKVVDEKENKEKQKEKENEEEGSETKHGLLALENLVLLLNVDNTAVFREAKGLEVVSSLLMHNESRPKALEVIRQLVTTSNSDDEMAFALALMHSSSFHNFDLKIDIMKTLLRILKEGHKYRIVFRRVSGFVYLMSLLVSLEGTLSETPQSPWKQVDKNKVLWFIRLVFGILSIAMRYEPANARFFANEVRYSSLTEAIRLLGCFKTEEGKNFSMSCQNWKEDQEQQGEEKNEKISFFGNQETNIFQNNNIFTEFIKDLPSTLSHSLILLKHLYDLALDNFERPGPLNSFASLDLHNRTSSPSAFRQSVSVDQSSQICLPSLTPSFSNHEIFIVHPGSVVSILHLIPAITCYSVSSSFQKTNNLIKRVQGNVCLVLKSLVRSERNQQVMCDVGMLGQLFKHLDLPLYLEKHLLHQPLQYIFERLSAQSLTPKELRNFFRLGLPLCCASEEMISSDSRTKHSLTTLSDLKNSVFFKESKQLETNESLEPSFFPLTRVKCLVSMTTPREIRVAGVNVVPAFVEFDMSHEGFGCLFLPSIAPQGYGVPSSIVPGSMIGAVTPASTMDQQVSSGIGIGERTFPPTTGLTFLSWICVDRFSNSASEGHPLRFLSITRSIRGENIVCLNIYLSSLDKSLIISTQETPIDKLGSIETDQMTTLNSSNSSLSDSFVKISCPELTLEGQWRHLAVVLQKASSTKNSSVLVLVDDLPVANLKLPYISSYLFPSSSSYGMTISGYIGSPLYLRKPSHLLWRQGPCYLIEDALNPSLIQFIYRLGPNYVGSFQAQLEKQTSNRNSNSSSSFSSNSLINEEKIIFGIHAHVMSIMTIAKIRKIFNKVDAKSIAKQLSLSTHENATPIRILHNSAGHLQGPARSIGGICIGYLGVRNFCPRPVSKVIMSVAGTSSLLSLIAMASSVEGLYASVKALVCVVRSNKEAAKEMDLNKGYQYLAMILKKKKSLLNSHILHLTFALVGTLDSGRESCLIPNKGSFENLLADLDIWHEAPYDLQKSLYEHLYDLLIDSSEKQKNKYLMLEMGLVAKLLNIANDPLISSATLTTISSLIYVLLSGPPYHSHSLLRFGQFAASLIPCNSMDERTFNLSQPLTKSSKQLHKNNITESNENQNSNHNKSENDDHNDDKFSKNETVIENSQSHPEVHKDFLFDNTGSLLVFNIKLRNICLDIILKLISSSLPHSSSISSSNNVKIKNINSSFCEELHKTLGLDWLLLFMSGQCHSTTVTLATNILFIILQSHPVLMQRFKEGSGGGGWLAGVQRLLANRMSLLGGLNMQGKMKSQLGVGKETNMELCNVAGFVVLNWLLNHHTHLPTTYFLCLKLFLNLPITSVSSDVQFNMDSIWTEVFQVSEAQVVQLEKMKFDFCLEGAILLLSFVRTAFSLPYLDQETETWAREYPITIMQFLLYLYQNHLEIRPLCQTPEFLGALCSTLFPIRHTQESNSGSTSPSEEFKLFSSLENFSTQIFQEKDHLTSHVARKFVIDFLKRIIFDSLSFPFSPKTPPVIDIILEISPDFSTRIERKQFQTELLSVLMDHLLMWDILLEEEGALMTHSSINSSAQPCSSFPAQNSNQTLNYIQLSSNVFYLAGRVVDKLWQGCYTKNSNDVFEFINLLICQAKRKSSQMSLENIYKSLNRTILFQLSRPLTSLDEFTWVNDTLHKLLANKILVFGPSNNDIEFISCLTYCLLQLSDSSPNNINSPQALRTTTWHLNEEEQIQTKNNKDQENDGNFDQLKKLAFSASKVWDELFLCKKQILEDVFKVNLVGVSELGNPHKMSAPHLLTIKHQIIDQATKIWLLYYEQERKCLYSQHEKLNSQIYAYQKLQKVGLGMMRLASRKSKKENFVKNVFITQPEWMSGTSCHLSMLKDLVELRLKQNQQSQTHVMEYLLEEWRQIEGEMMRERGLWGPQLPSPFTKWVLDATEGPCRMRKKMIRNENFYQNYPYRPELEANKELKYKVAVCLDSKLYAENYKGYSFIEGKKLLAPGLVERQPIQSQDSTQELVKFNGESIDEERLNKAESILKDCKKQNSEMADEDGFEPESESSNLSTSSSQPAPFSSSSTTSSSFQTSDTTPQFPRSEPQADNQAIYRLLEEGETITHMFRCARIQGLDTLEGLLLFVKDHFYIVDGFTLVTSRNITDIVDIDSLPPDSHEPIIPKSGKSLSSKKMCFKMAFGDMREVHKRRYLLQPIAIEIFSADGRNFLLVFPKKMRNKIYQKFLTLGTSLTDNARESVSGQRLNAKVEQSGNIISSLIGEKSVTQRWERGEISNFEYLMCLNTLAGRSYNDLMQYPVFPWILADYDSHQLDLYNPTTFRDLTSPMGAQTPERLKQFKKRYSDWDDPHGETPPYHYGTHYSSAMIVASYLVRVEPFTQTFLKLQGGHFDLADRMFHSIKDAWLSASKHNMADVKELIPEFFYLPEFLLNLNNFDLGVKQNGVALNDVVLPPWAKGDPREFIRIHREALECDYVSSKLHEWIDLIFGFKQQTPAAVEAVNVFHHLFYEGNVNIYDIEDPLKKTAIIGFINNFGQIPKQLFKKPHPAKRLSLKLNPPMITFYPTSYSPNEKFFFHNLDNLTTSLQPIKELKGSVGLIVTNERFLLAVEQHKTLVPPLYTRYLAWGYPDMSIKMGSYDSEKKSSLIVEDLEFGDILCAVCPNERILITGGTNTVVKIWKLNYKKDASGRLNNSNPIEFKKSLFGHIEAVTCLAVSSSYNIIISGSRDKTCIMWDLNELSFVRQLRGHSAPVAAVHINDLTGDITTCSGCNLYLWSVNGDQLASISSSPLRDHQILCLTMTQIKEWDNNNVIITGSNDGVVKMWSLEFVQVKKEKNNQIDSQIDNNLPLESFEDEIKNNKEEEKNNDENNEKQEKNIEEESGSRRGSVLKSWLEKNAEKKKNWGEDVEDGEEEKEVGSLVSRNEWVKSFLEEEKSFTPPHTPHNSRKDIFANKFDLPSNSCSSPTIKTRNTSASSFKDFYFVNKEEINETLLEKREEKKDKKKYGLKEGFEWKRQLVFRSKLTIHTAFERKDNKEPAPITALSISKDHKIVYVGDGKGRIFSWSVSEQGSRSILDHWVKDDGGDFCHYCKVKFFFAERRHHCRNCGQVFCSKCTNYEIEVKKLKIGKPAKVCQNCYLSLKSTSSNN